MPPYTNHQPVANINAAPPPSHYQDWQGALGIHQCTCITLPHFHVPYTGVVEQRTIYMNWKCMRHWVCFLSDAAHLFIYCCLFSSNISLTSIPVSKGAHNLFPDLRHTRANLLGSKLLVCFWCGRKPMKIQGQHIHFMQMLVGFVPSAQWKPKPFYHLCNKNSILIHTVLAIL